MGWLIWKGLLMRKRGAFSLVELLVIVGILSVLLAILAPSLGRAKELARRAVCASNLKQIGTSVGAYAAQSREWLPTLTGHGGTTLSVTHWVRWFYVEGYGDYCYWNLGLLHKTHLATEGGLFYCPSEPDMWFQLETYSPWHSNYQSGTSANGVRIAYGFNPYVVDPDAPDKSRLYKRHATMPPYRVLASDLVQSRSTVAHVRDFGWNVLYPHGGVTFVIDRSIYDDDLAQSDFAGQNFPAHQGAMRKLEAHAP